MFDIAHIGDAIAVNRSMALPGREACATNEACRAVRRALEESDKARWSAPAPPGAAERQPSPP
jgi:hypothetical protein